MKTLFATLAAATAVAAIAAPAAAQSYDRDGRHDRDGRYEQPYNRDGGSDRRHDNVGYNIDARQLQLNQRIERGQRRGTLDRHEAASLWSFSREIGRMENRYRVGGLNWNERVDLDRRLDRLEVQIARETRDRDYGRR